MSAKHERADADFGIVSFFTGAGFMDLGFEEAGFKSMMANEIDPSFATVYEYSKQRMHKPPASRSCSL